MVKIILLPGEIRAEKLTESNLHHIGTFSSGVCKELEKFLKENAWLEQKISFSTTYLFFHKDVLVGYVTLLGDKQALNIKFPNPSLSKFCSKVDDKYQSVPGLKLGRLCVIDDFNSQLESAHYKNLGIIMFAFVVNIAKNSPIGCRVITTHAKKATNAYLWYEKIGFRYSHSDEKTKDLLAREDQDAIPMFYDINRIV